MSEMPKEQKEYYADIAEKHANFLAEKVFKPAFIIAFVHGVKHGRKDAFQESMITHPEYTVENHDKKPVQKTCKRRKKE